MNSKRLFLHSEVEQGKTDSAQQGKATNSKIQ